VIMDNASYHGAKTTPNKSARKQVIYDYIKSQIDLKRITLTLKPIEKMRKPELESMLDQVITHPSMAKHIYELDEIASENGHEILRLPPYHCHFNPIEFHWKDVKHNIQKQNTLQKLDTIKRLAEKELQEFNKAISKKHWDHIINLRDKAWKDDGFYDTVAATSRIVITNSDTDDEDDEIDTISETIDRVVNMSQEDYEREDEVTYGDEAWMLEDDVDFNSDAFTNENEIGRFMAGQPARKRARFNPACNPNHLFQDDE